MVQSLGGSRYYVKFIDDATKKNWVYCIRKKSDVFDTFKKWKYLANNETRNKLKCLKFDMEVNTAARILIVIVHTMVLV